LGCSTTLWRLYVRIEDLEFFPVQQDEVAGPEQACFLLGERNGDDREWTKSNLETKSVDVLPLSVRRVGDLGVSWWPGVLKGNLDIARVRREGFVLYEVERPANSVMTDVLLFAVDWSNGRGFFYQTSKANK